MNTGSLSALSLDSTSFHLAKGGIPSSPNLDFSVSIFCSLQGIKEQKRLPFDSLVFSLLIKQFINEVLEQLLTVTLLNVLEAAVNAHKPCNLVELTQSTQFLALFLQKLREALFLLLPAEPCLISFPRFLFIDELIEGGLSFGQCLEGLDANVVGCDSLCIIPAPGGCNTCCFQSILKNCYTVVFGKGVKLRLSPYLRTLGSKVI